jgi:hypothetical protein
MNLAFLIVALMFIIPAFAEAQLRSKSFVAKYTDTSSDEDGFKLYIKKGDGTYELSAQVGPNIQSITSAPVQGVEGSNWCFLLASFNAGGEGRTGDVCAIIPFTIPLAPTTLAGSITQAKLVSLNWKDMADNETGVKVYRNGVEIASLGAGVVGFSETVTGAVGTVYVYEVAAFNSAGISAKSNGLKVTVPSILPPTAPTGFSLSALSASEIQASWGDNTLDEDQFRVTLRTFSPPRSTIYTAAANLTELTIAGLTKNKTHCGRVVAVRGVVSSIPSNEACATTKKE